MGLEVLIRGCSSVGRAHGLQPWGQGFDSPHLHQSVADLRLPIAGCNRGRILGVLDKASEVERSRVER